MTKIMLVEDDKSLREIYSIRLVAEGYDIVSAGDGEEALALAVQEKPDLIISDVMMPKISGFDMLDILRSTPETAKIKVIMMTALSSDDQRMRGETLGADRYLVKSQVGIEDVINTVHEVLGDKPNASASVNLDVAAAVPPKAPEAAASTPAPTPAPAPMPAAPAPAAPAPTAPQAPVAPAPAPAPMPTTPVAPAPAPIPAAPTPAPVAPRAPVAPAGQPGGGERVIQPINDPTSSQNREEMQRKMDELLGNAPAPAPMPAAPTPAAPAPATPAPTAPQAPVAPAPAPMPTTPVAPAPVPVEQSRPTQTAQEEPAPVDPNVIQPGYIQSLADDLSRDMQGQEADPGSMAARMSADLQNDPLTQQAQSMPLPPDPSSSPNVQA